MNTIPMYQPMTSTDPAEFKLVSAFDPAGDQPEAVQALVNGLKNGERDQVLLGVTGSGKTFTMAQIIKQMKRPALILAPNKILAAQLYGEMKSFFPETPSSILFLITIIISPKPIFRARIHTLKKILPLTNRLTVCATAQRGIFWNAATS